MIKNPFINKISDAEFFGKVSSDITEHNIQQNNDIVAYWTKNTIIPSGTLYAYTGITSGNIWHEISDQDLESTTFYGLPANTTLSGDIHFYAKNIDFRNAVFCGAASSKCKNAYITLENVNTSGACYCSMGEIDNYYVHLISGVYSTLSNTTSNFYIFQRGSGLGNTKVTTNNIYFTCDAGEFNLSPYIGPSVKTKAAATSKVCEINNIYATFNDGTGTTNAISGSIFCGGICAGQTNVDVASFNEINVDVNGGKWFDSINLINAVGIFGGPAVTNGRVTINSINMELNGGDVSTLFGGGYPQGNGQIDVLGDVNITINNGTIGNVAGLGTASKTLNNGYFRYHGNIYLHLNGGNIINIVHPGVRHSDWINTNKEVLYGEAYIIFNGNTDYSCYFQGNILHNETTSEPNCHIIFENYTGSLNGAKIIGFKDIQFTKNCSVYVENVTFIHNVDTLTLDLTHRSVDSSLLPLIRRI